MATDRGMLGRLGHRLRRRAFYRLWRIYGYVGPHVSLPLREKVTVIIPSYSVERLDFIESNVRALLKCDFVERVIVSNHNPATRIGARVRIKDARLVLLDQPVRRGCGWGWLVASQFDPDYLISIDDDLLAVPNQVAALFQKLVAEPAIPHGRAGAVGSQYYQCPTGPSREMEVDTLYIVYAVTRAHLRRYRELLEALTRGHYASNDIIEYLADDVLISRAGSGRPKIHNVGRLFHLPTFDKPGVATHRTPGFEEKRLHVRRAVDHLNSFRSVV
ncbi:MAG TPA: hypothetical protein VMW56_32340 [Candidatus Margulisiibacteriota bacterium]|nr:hypothetical protein [Candidatus Margulisiibacteriota bacterium]